MGSDFSGMETPSLSLDDVGIPTELLFCTEHGPAPAKILKHCLKPVILYKDVRKRKVATMQKTDMFTSGFPCQAYSKLGKKQALLNVINSTSPK